MKHISWKRFLALTLCLMLMLSSMSVAAWAEPEAEDPVETELPEEPAPAADPEPEEPEVLPIEAEDGEIEALIPDEDTAEPEADPVDYDLWVCGKQVTSANKNAIAGTNGLRFNPDTATLTVYNTAAAALTNPELYNGAVIYSELPALTIYFASPNLAMESDTASYLIYENGGSLTLRSTSSGLHTLTSSSAYYGVYVAGGDLTVDTYLKVAAPAAEYGFFVENGSLLLGKVTINYSTGPKDCVPVVLFESVQNAVGITNGTISGTAGLERSTLTINGTPTSFTNPTLQGDTVQNAMVTTDDANLTFGGSLRIFSKAAQFGVKVPNGTVTNTGNLSVSLRGDTADSCIYAENGLSSDGALSVSDYECNGGYGIKVMNGSVTINGEVTYISAEHTGIYCGNGDVNITGVTSFSINHNEEGELSVSSGVYAANGSVTMGAFGLFGGANWVVYANGPIHITDAFNLVNEGDLLGGNGIKSTQGGIVLDGNATITAINCIVSEGEEGIRINGDATLTANGRYAMSATNGPITVNGNLKATGAMYTAVTAKGDITVEGNATASASTPAQSPDFPGNAMESTDGSINVSGDLNCTGTKNPCYAKHDIRVGGNATINYAAGTTAPATEFGIKAENGEITVGGTLTCKGKAAYAVWAGTSVTVEKDVTVTNTAEGSIGMYANGFLNFVSGKWDVTAATAALQAGNGIQIPQGYGVTTPGRGIVAQVDGLHTVTASDRTTVAAHAIIEAKEYTEGYYLIGPDWTLNGVIPTDKFETNPDNTNEYMLETTLAVGDKIKVVKLTDGEITAWYPEGYNTEYTVDQAHSGKVMIYFKTSYDPAWSEFGGFIYIVHVHDWGKPTWTWAEDYSSATATFVCAGDPSHTVTLDAVVTVEKFYDCEFGTFVDYTATVQFEGKEYKGYKNFDYPNGHPWGEPTWEWAEDYSSATATFVCTADASHTKTVNAVITSETVGNEKIYTATVELDGETYTDTKTVLNDHEHADADGDLFCDTCGERMGVLVSVTSASGTLDGPTVAFVKGGAKLYFGESTTVEASNVAGYTFDGWYLNGEKVSDQLRYSYTAPEGATEDVKFVALYIGSGTFRLTVTGSKFTISGLAAAQRNYFDDLLAANTQVTVTFQGSADESFLYWVNDNGKIVSTSTDYTFYMVAHTKLHAVCAAADASQNEALVVFVNSRSNGQVLASHYYTATDAIAFPAAPSMMGREFAGWSMTEEEIKAKMATDTKIVVYAVFAAATENYSVTVSNNVNEEQTVYTRAAGEQFTINADLTLGSFSYWMMNGKIVSYDTSIAVRSMTDLALTAVYNETVEPVPVITMTEAYGTPVSDYYTVTFVAMRGVPEGWTVQRQGIVYTNRTDLAGLDLSEIMVLDGSGMKEYTSSSTDRNGVCVLNINTRNARIYHARGFMILMKDGVTQTIYSDEILEFSYTP